MAGLHGLMGTVVPTSINSALLLKKKKSPENKPAQGKSGRTHTHTHIQSKILPNSWIKRIVGLGTAADVGHDCFRWGTRHEGKVGYVFPRRESSSRCSRKIPSCAFDIMVVVFLIDDIPAKRVMLMRGIIISL